MKINLEKEFETSIQNPVSEEEKQMAVTIGTVILGKKLSAHEWNVGLMGGEEMSPAEYLDPDVELPAPREGWLERLRLKNNIIPTWRAVHKAWACNLPVAEYTCDAENGSQKVYKAWRYAQAKNMKVKTNILGIDFYVTPDMTEEEAGLSAQAAIVNHGGKMEQVMAEDVFDVTGHTQAWAHEKKSHPKEAAYAERLGKLVQAEMKTSGQPFVPMMFARAATFQDQIYGDNGANHQKAGHMLFMYWAHGEKLAEACGQNTEEIRRARKICMDVKKTGNDGPQM